MPSHICPMLSPLLLTRLKLKVMGKNEKAVRVNVHKIQLSVQVLLQIPSNNCVLRRILVAMAIKVKNL